MPVMNKAFHPVYTGFRGAQAVSNTRIRSRARSRRLGGFAKALEYAINWTPRGKPYGTRHYKIRFQFIGHFVHELLLGMKTNLPAVAREVKRVYFETDVRMKAVPKACSKGCSHCCHQNVRVHSGEGPTIEKYIREEMPSDIKQQVKANLTRWLKYFDKSTAQNRVLLESDILQFERQIAKDRVPCALLVNNECSIYKARPLVCRTHSVNDSPSICQGDPHRNGDMKGVTIQQQQFSAISKASDMVGIRLLAYAVQETLDVNHVCKPIGFDVVPTLRPHVQQ